MKISTLTSAALGVLMALASVTAAPAPREVNGLLVSREELPPLISDRVSPPTSVPVVELDAEVQVEAINGPLPTYLETKGGFSMTLGNVTNPPLAVFPSLSRVALPLASASKITILKTYMSLSASAYCESVCPGGKWTCSTCGSAYTFIKSFKGGSLDANGYITRNDKTKEIELVFRGSGSNANWVANLQFIKKSYPPVSGASVHTGFYNAYIQSQATVLSLVRAQLTAYPSYRIVVTGHSLGGALAPLAAFDLYQRDARISKSNLFIYTYGAPRIGNANFAYYASHTGITYERTVNDRDIVPHLPPQKFGFLHAGIEYWITNDISVVKICNTVLDSKICANSIVPFTSFMDHAKYFDISAIC